MCGIAVFYQDVVARDRALHLLDRLLGEFKGEPSFEGSWWGFKYLQHSEIHPQAAAAVAAADLILVSIAPQQGIPAEVKAWFDRCLVRWPPLQAALGLLESPRFPSGLPSPDGAYFQGLAQRAGLDYLALTVAPPALPSAPSLPGYSSNLAPALRAHPFQERYHSSGWGINE